MPFVASEACWRKTVEFVDDSAGVPVAVEGGAVDVGLEGRGMARMSMGMLRRWQAKMAFMIGIYWWARSVVGEAEMRRMRDWRRAGDEVSAVCCAEGSVATPTIDSE